jgi:hypothetical protein
MCVCNCNKSQYNTIFLVSIVTCFIFIIGGTFLMLSGCVPKYDFCPNYKYYKGFVTDIFCDIKENKNRCDNKQKCFDVTVYSMTISSPNKSCIFPLGDTFKDDYTLAFYGSSVNISEFGTYCVYDTNSVYTHTGPRYEYRSAAILFTTPNGDCVGFGEGKFEREFGWGIFLIIVGAINIPFLIFLYFCCMKCCVEDTQIEHLPNYPKQQLPNYPIKIKSNSLA